MNAFIGARQAPTLRHSPPRSFARYASFPIFLYSASAVCFPKSHANFPLSMITPLIELPPPFMYFDVECTTISAPYSNGFIR